MTAQAADTSLRPELCWCTVVAIASQLANTHMANISPSISSPLCPTPHKHKQSKETLPYLHPLRYKHSKDSEHKLWLLLSSVWSMSRGRLSTVTWARTDKSCSPERKALLKSKVALESRMTFDVWCPRPQELHTYITTGTTGMSTTNNADWNRICRQNAHLDFLTFSLTMYQKNIHIRKNHSCKHGQHNTSLHKVKLKTQ